MKKIRKNAIKKMDGALASFALFFAGISYYGICFYIFHQPKMPEELLKQNEK